MRLANILAKNSTILPPSKNSSGISSVKMCISLKTHKLLIVNPLGLDNAICDGCLHLVGPCDACADGCGYALGWEGEGWHFRAALVGPMECEGLRCGGLFLSVMNDWDEGGVHLAAGRMLVRDAET